MKDKVQMKHVNGGLHPSTVKVIVQPAAELHSPISTQDSEHSLNLGIENLDNEGRFDAYSKVSLSWKDVNVSVQQQSDGSCCKKSSSSNTINILRGVSGIVEPGQFMAIMGASGAGKTTLLNTLAFRNEDKLKCSGEINVNGVGISKSQMKLISAYVQQEDYFIGTLTVREVMMFHANLRMDKDISQEKKKKKVKAILLKLGLTKVQDSLCGYPAGGMIRGISGGERKRLSVATELLMDPPLLFIDEPTSGLDSFMAENIVKLIRKLAEANRTVMCTIHQPASQIFALFDRVCLVAEGRIAYIGKTSDAMEHFRKAGSPCPNNFNPADHYIFTLAIRPGKEQQCRARCEELTEFYTQSDHYSAISERIKEVEDEALNKSLATVNRRKIQSPIWQQIKENFRRSFLNTIRNPGYTRSRIGQVIVFSLLAGLVFLNTTLELPNVAQDRGGCLFFLCISFTFGNVFVQTQSIPLELPVVKREYQNGMYTTLPYLISKLITEIPFMVGLPLLQLAICYFMIGLRASAEAFFTTLVCCIGITWSATGMGWFIATMTGDPQIASVIAAPIIMPFLLFGGLFQNGDSTPVYFLPFKYTSWFRYGYNMLMVNEFKGLELECPDAWTGECYNGTEILNQFGINSEELWWPNMFALCVFGAVMCLIAWGCLMCRVRR